MQCKFIQHGLSVGYDQVIKPCCAWHYDSTYKQENHIKVAKLEDWHTSKTISDASSLLAQDIWPSNCATCEKFEANNRNDSMRANGNSGYADYEGDDITLEIRPGSTCNFACQTCWPEASSRVLEYYKKADLINYQVDTNRLDDFTFLLPVKDRIKSVVLLGGEPFYDKACIKFLAWARQNLTATITMFTNASYIDWEFIENYPNKLVVVVSLDAVGKAAEYVRFGTVWEDVVANYQQLKQYSHVEVRVNVTTSVWNYAELGPLMALLGEDWPALVTFGKPRNSYQLETSVPPSFRPELIAKLAKAVQTIHKSSVPQDQKINALGVLASIITNLKEDNFKQSDFDYLKSFVASMDKVKNIQVADYCPFLAAMLS